MLVSLIHVSTVPLLMPIKGLLCLLYVAYGQRKKACKLFLAREQVNYSNLDLHFQFEASKTSNIISFTKEIGLEIATNSICIH